MRRFGVLVSVLAVVLLGLVAIEAQPPVMAQEATPASDEMGMEGLTFALLGIAPGVTLPSAADVEVARVGFAPGAGFPFESFDK